MKPIFIDTWSTGMNEFIFNLVILKCLEANSDMECLLVFENNQLKNLSALGCILTLHLFILTVDLDTSATMDLISLTF